MKSSLIALLAFITASSFTGLAAGQVSTDTTLHVEYFASITGRNSNGQLIEGIVSFDADDDPNETRIVETFIDGSTDLGFAGITVSATATHGNPKKLLSAEVDGFAGLKRPACCFGTVFETGAINVGGTAIATYHDVITFTTLQSLLTDPMHVEGFVRLHAGPGGLDATFAREGSNIGGQAQATVILSGTGMSRDAKQAFVNTSHDGTIISSHPSPNVINMFSYDVIPGADFRIEFKMEVRGSANISGPQFTVPESATADALFSADFLNTLDWGGITSVTNARTGEPITDWTVTSASGFDYTQFFPDVPEPSSYVLLLSAAVCGNCLVRRGAARRALR